MPRTARFTALAAGAAALLASAPLQARIVGSWEVARSKQGSCMMIATYGNGTVDGISLGLVWSPAENRLGFLAASKNWNDLLSREGDPTALQLSFDGDVDYSQWLHEAARFENLGGIETIAGSWGAENSERLAAAVTGSGAVRLQIGETDLGSFDISGSAEAYRELLRCGERG